MDESGVYAQAFSFSTARAILLLSSDSSCEHDKSFLANMRAAVFDRGECCPIVQLKGGSEAATQFMPASQASR
jgi:hypothetical protein